MFTALYGQFIINLCLLLYMCVQIYKNHLMLSRIKNNQHYVEKSIIALTNKQQETDANIEKYKKNMAMVMVQISKELDVLEAKRKRGR